jgi:hypothetical protein
LRGFSGVRATLLPAEREMILVYRVASLPYAQEKILARWLLNHSGITDLYVVRPGGYAVGYSLEAETADQLYPSGYVSGACQVETPTVERIQPKSRLNGVQDMGWPHGGPNRF